MATRMNHYKSLRCKTQTSLYASLAKYGFCNHIVEVIDRFTSNLSYSNDKEMFWIRTNMSNKNKYPTQNGLNLTDGGFGQVGHRMTDENKKKLSEMHKSGQRKTNKGQKRTPEQVEAMRKRLIGKPNYKLRGRIIPEDQRRKHSENMKGHTFNRGRVMSEEIKERNRSLHTKLRGKPFLQYTLDGVAIKEFGSLGQASRELNMLKGTIAAILKKQFKTPRCGFIFKYKQPLTFEKQTFQRRVFQPQDIKEKIA